MSRHRINASLFFRIYSGVLLVSVLQALFTPCTDVFPRLKILGEGLPVHLSGMWLFLHRLHHELPEDDMDSSSGYTVPWGAVDTTEACPRISAKQTFPSKSSMWVCHYGYLTVTLLSSTFPGPSTAWGFHLIHLHLLIKFQTNRLNTFNFLTHEDFGGSS